MGARNRKGTDYLLKWLFLLPHWMSVSDSFHDMTMILLPMTNIHDFMIPHPHPKVLRTLELASTIPLSSLVLSLE